MTREVLAFAGSADLARRRLGGTSRAPTPHRGAWTKPGRGWTAYRQAPAEARTADGPRVRAVRRGGGNDCAGVEHGAASCGISEAALVTGARVSASIQPKRRTSGQAVSSVGWAWCYAAGVETART